MKVNSKKQSDDQWERIAVDKNLVENSIKLAERDIKTSKDIFDNNDYDWSFSIAWKDSQEKIRAWHPAPQYH